MWKTVKLGEACLVRRGTTITKKQTVEGEVPVIGGGTKPTYFHNEPNRAANCITVSGSGASAGFVNKWAVPIFASDCSTVEPKDETQLHQFVYYYLMSQQQFIYDNFRSGAAQPHVYAKDIETLDYPIVPLAEQQRIVAKLDAAFAEIDRAIELSNASSKHADALLEKLIVTITSFAGEGEVKKIADVTEMQSGYAFKSGDYSDNAADTPLLRGDNIAPDSIDFSKAKRLPTDLATDYKKFELLRDDVILAMDRPYISTGLRLAKINEAHLPCLLVQRVMRLRTKPNLIPDFLHLAMQKPCFLQHILGNQTGLGVPHISGKTIGSYEFAIPDLQKQSHIVAKANKAKSQIKKLRASHEKCAVELTKLKSAILSQELQPPQSEAA